MLQATNILFPDGTSVTTEYHPTGELKRNYGSRTYPVGYGYDYAGRMTTMTNWSAFPSTGARVTTWNYDSQRGWLSTKTYDGGVSGPSYTYTPAGRLATRLWARGTNTVYTYTLAGNLETVTYSDGTPGVTYTYDRLGRQRTITCNGMTTTFTNNLAGQLLGESNSGGTLDGLLVSNRYDAYMRRTNLSAFNGEISLSVASYGYDAASRLKAVSDGANAAVGVGGVKPYLGSFFGLGRVKP
jgi:YD repeat-containing protein